MMYQHLSLLAEITITIHTHTLLPTIGVVDNNYIWPPRSNSAVSRNAKDMNVVNTGSTLLGGLSSAASLGASAQTYKVAAQNDMIAP